MPSASAADGPAPSPPPELRSDRAAFLAAVQREASRLAPEHPLRKALQDPRVISSWDRYAGLVYTRSARQSLVAERDRARLYTRHILDSLNPLDLCTPPPRSLLDIGSGAGFPGIPLAIVWSDTRVTLLESRERKVGFLERAIRELALGNVIAVEARLEDYGRDRSSGGADVVTIRAVGGLGKLLPHASRAAAPGATWVYFLGSGERAEAVLGSLNGTPFAARPRTGLFGGTLLVGALSPAS
jgi:16S rRNA (guanine(527)-N(7))-methyltransferase RsmG